MFAKWGAYVFEVGGGGGVLLRLAQAVPKTHDNKDSSNSWQTPCLGLPGDGTIGMSHHSGLAKTAKALFYILYILTWRLGVTPCGEENEEKKGQEEKMEALEVAIMLCYFLHTLWSFCHMVLIIR